MDDKTKLLLKLLTKAECDPFAFAPNEAYSQDNYYLAISDRDLIRIGVSLSDQAHSMPVGPQRSLAFDILRGLEMETLFIPGWGGRFITYFKNHSLNKGEGSLMAETEFQARRDY